MVEAAGHVAIVAQLDADPVGQPRLGDAPAGVVVLLARQGDAGDARATFLGRQLGEAAPAAADLQDMVVRAGVEQVQQAPVFAPLGRFQAVVAGREDGRGVGHRRVQPVPVEVVAQIIVERDVAPAAAARVGAQRVAHVGQRAQQRRAAQIAGHGVPVQRGQLDHLDHVGAVPVAVEIGPREAHAAAQHQPAGGAPAVDVQHRVGTGVVADEGAFPAIGQAQGQAAVDQLAFGHVQQPARAGRGDQRADPPARGGQPAGVAHAAGPFVRSIHDHSASLLQITGP